MMTEENSQRDRNELRLELEEKLHRLNDLEKEGKDDNYIKVLGDIALLQLQLGEYKSAESNFLICLNHFEKQKDKMGQSSVYGLLATLNYEKGKYNKSLNYFNKSYEISSKYNQTSEQIICLRGIGNCYLRLNQLNNAIETFFDCADICSKNNELYSFLDCLGNLINIYEAKNQWDIVFDLYKKTLQVFKKMDDSIGQITSYYNLGIVLKKQEKYRESLKYYKLGTLIAKKSNYIEYILKGLNFIGESLFYLRDINNAKKSYIEALYLAKKFKIKDTILQMRILLNSLGLTENQIEDELRKFRQSEKNA